MNVLRFAAEALADKTPVVRAFTWKILLILIFVRPFLCEYALLSIGVWYMFFVSSFSVVYLAIIRKRIVVMDDIYPALFMIIIVFSMVYSGFTRWSALEFCFFIPNIIIFYIARSISPSEQKQLLGAIITAAIVMCLYAIYQYFIGLQRIAEYISRGNHGQYIGYVLYKKRVFATFVSPNVCASYFIMMLFISIGLARDNQGLRKFMYWMGVAVIALSLLYTKSLGAIVTVGVIFLLVVRYFSVPLNLRRSETSRGKCVRVILLIAVVLTLGMFLSERLLQLFDVHRNSNSVIQRFYYWSASVNMIKEFPLTGIGWRKFGALYEFYKPCAANISHYSHNVFLQIAAETGLLGLISFLLIVTMFMRNGLSVIRNHSNGRLLKAGLFCAGCAFLVHNMADASFYFGQVAFFWWILAGLFSNFRWENS
jgi:putative inorganic carbon (hco3(-)) transporter